MVHPLPSPPLVGRSSLRRRDAVVAGWVVVWLVVGIWTGVTVWQLSSVGDTVSESGRSLSSAGKALQVVGKVPFVGGDAATLGEQTSTTAVDVTARGHVVKHQLRRLAVLLGVVVSIVPSVPVAGFYVPFRLRRRRERRWLAHAVATHPDDPELDQHLAERALAALPLMQLRSVEPHPYAAVRTGHTRRLADLELARLGLRRGA